MAAPLVALLPTFGTPTPPATVIAPVRPAPVAAIAPAAVVIPAIMSPAITNLDDIALRGYGRPVNGHGGCRRDGSEGRTDGNGSGEKDMCELHGCFLIDDEAKMRQCG